MSIAAGGWEGVAKAPGWLRIRAEIYRALQAKCLLPPNRGKTKGEGGYNTGPRFFDSLDRDNELIGALGVRAKMRKNLALPECLAWRPILNGLREHSREKAIYA